MSSFVIEERFGLNKKDKKEFVKEQCIDGIIEFVMMIVIMGFLIFVCEHSGWLDKSFQDILSTILFHLFWFMLCLFSFDATGKLARCFGDETAVSVYSLA